MNSTSTKKRDRRGGYVPEWIWEIGLVATILPGVLYGISAVGSFPIV